MKTLALIFGLVSFFYAIMDFLPPGFQRAKVKFKDWFLKKCQTIILLDDQTLMNKLKPWMYGIRVWSHASWIACPKYLGT